MTWSPFLVTWIINKYEESYNNKDPELVEQFLRKLHVDDLNSEIENIQEG